MHNSAEAAALRKRFPYVSLISRLRYEERHEEQAGDHQEPVLLKPALERLKAAEQYAWLFGQDARIQSLQKLHSIEATLFVNSEGNGRARFRRYPSPAWLDHPEPDPIPLAGDSLDSAEESGEETVTLPEQELREEPAGAWTPSREMLGNFHADSNHAFADPWTFGHVKDRDHVAGFVSHGFSELPVLTHPENEQVRSKTDAKWIETHPARWTIARLELVSLLKFDKPAVYVSEHLPRMAELVDATTRPLNPFEARALERLRAGEDIVATAGRNHIRMLGSLRATKQCLGCHAGPRGALLGAFSYRLRRDPPLPSPWQHERPFESQ
jgi:hypothetical protein